MSENEESFKKINIMGINNRYQIKKLVKKNENKNKKRMESIKWDFTNEEIVYNKQLAILKDIVNKKNENAPNINDSDINDSNINEQDEKIRKIMIQQINQKITGYKQQDINKKRLDETRFIDFYNVVNKMIDNQLNCYYCKQNMDILYDISREKKQWTIDRINNEDGHNNNNYHLACLECNLKRRRQTADHFLFTKQLHIIKKDL